MTLLSLNEIETIALKAARGAGFAWGLAEEIGVGARWLAEAGLAWAPALLALLDGEAGGAQADQCPVRAGCRLLDAATLPQGGIVLVARLPIWLLPFAGRLAACLDRRLALTGPGFASQVLVGRDGMEWSNQGATTAKGAAPASHSPGLDPAYRHLPSTACVETTIGLAADTLGRRASAPPSRPAGVPADLLARLAAYEALTYVPASSQSRIEGAGAGLTDND